MKINMLRHGGLRAAIFLSCHPPRCRERLARGLTTPLIISQATLVSKQVKKKFQADA